MTTTVLEDGSVRGVNRPPQSVNELGRRLNQTLDRILDLEDQVRALRSHIELDRDRDAQSRLTAASSVSGRRLIRIGRCGPSHPLGA